MRRLFLRLIGSLTLLGVLASSLSAAEADADRPWLRDDRALVIDAYEYNVLDWQQLATDKRIVGFINKASDGLPPPYLCNGGEIEVRLCKSLWRRHAVARELFHTRRMVARALGLKWGAYHLARPGNPIAQAENFLDFAEPGPDDLMALDLEGNDPSKWMSFDEAEIFARHIQARTGRFPILYTNGTTARHIADNAGLYPILSRLPLWYARYKPGADAHFPMGHWKEYALWQFAAQANCNKRGCPYRVAGAGHDIDVNVASTTAAGLRAQWPFGQLLDAPRDMLVSVPLPVSREAAIAGAHALTYVDVEWPSPLAGLAMAFAEAGERYPERGAAMPAATVAAALDPTPVGAITSMPGGDEFAGSEPSTAFDRHGLPLFLLKQAASASFEGLFRASDRRPAMTGAEHAGDRFHAFDPAVDALLVRQP